MIVDDDAVYAQALAAYFTDRTADIAIEEVAYTALEGVERVLELRPDVVVMDLCLPDGNGIDAALDIRRKSRRTKVLIVSCEDDVATMNLALNAGISGYVVKTAGVEAVVEAVRTVYQEHFIFDERARKTLVELVEGPASPDQVELVLLGLAARGMTNK